MSSIELKKYLQILNEAENFQSLNDAGDAYSPGNTEIWYWHEDLGRDFTMGYKWIRDHNVPFDPNNLEQTHALVGKIAETDPETVWSLMQGEAWSPAGEAYGFIQRLGVGHTSMSVGDIIRVNNKTLMVDKAGFTDVSSGEEA
jgi:hypothetical protein